MTRKSKAANGSSAMTQHERGLVAQSYGTQSARIGSDSRTPFGVCEIGLTEPLDAVCSKSGGVYDRATILQYLANKSKQIKEQRALYEAQTERILEKVRREDEEHGESKIKEFELLTSGVMAEDISSHAKGRKVGEKSKGFDVETKGEKSDRLKTTSYWLAAHAPTHEVLIEEPPKRPSSPTSGNPLRMKDLTPITITRAEDSNEPICAVSKNSLKNTQPIALKPSGIVISEKVFNEFMKDDDHCPVTGMKINKKKGDVIRLRRGGTGFASTSIKEDGEGGMESGIIAKKYKATMT